MEDAPDTTWEEVPDADAGGNAGADSLGGEGASDVEVGTVQDEGADDQAEGLVVIGEEEAEGEASGEVRGADAGGEGSGEKGNLGAGDGGSDAGRDSGDLGGATLDTGQGQVVTLSGESVNDLAEAYTGVTAEDFAVAVDSLNARVDAVFTSSVVLVIALFFSAGIAAIDTLLRSTEKF